MVKKIPLTQGQYALVDDEDFDFLKNRHWQAQFRDIKKGYVVYAKGVIPRGTKGYKTIWMHRLILNAPKGMEVDHINGNGLDNRKENLRCVSRRQNTQNRKNQKKYSEFPGVTWDKSRNKWKADIHIKGSNLFLGRFDDEREAAKAYERACRELVGEELVCKTKGVV